MAPSKFLVDLSPDENGDRIALVRDGQVSYLPATRVDIGHTHEGASGSCRYIRRASNGDLYVTGPSLRRTMFRSTDDGRSWSTTPYDLGMERFELRQMERDSEYGWIGAFTILRDDTFLIFVAPSNHRRSTEAYLSRSTDLGATWSTEPIDLPLGRYRSISAGNADMIELTDGTLLLTLHYYYYVEMEEEAALPFDQQASFGYVLRSTDGGRTWPEAHCHLLYGGEAHLLELPSGKILVASRKQRSTWLPGDPENIVVTMRANGYDPEYTGYHEPIGEGTAYYKHMAVSESNDGGRTWVNEQRVSGYEQCSGELTLLADGSTVVMTYDYRYPDRFAWSGVRGRVSYDAGLTWEPEEYVLGEGENYPGCIATDDGGMITVCPYRNRGPIQAVHWRPRPQNGSE